VTKNCQQTLDEIHLPVQNVRSMAEEKKAKQKPKSSKVSFIVSPRTVE